MKKVLAALAIVFALSLSAFGQGEPSRAPGRAFVTAYNHWAVQVASGNAATGTQTIQLKQGMVNLTDGRSINPFNVNAPITIDIGANQETVTPTSVSGCGSAAIPGQLPTCAITASFSFLHGPGTFVTSGTFGLQEAINDCASPVQPTKCGMVTVAGDFNGTDTTLFNSVLSPTFSSGATLPGAIAATVTIEDLRSFPPRYWAPEPSAVILIAAPAAPTLGVVTGGLSSGAYKGTEAYVDCRGGISLDSAESAATATTTGVTFPSPAATAGACGWLPRLSTAGGSGNEILAASPLTSANCPLSTLLPTSSIPACAIGATATITAANPSNTAKPSVESNAFVSYTPQPFSGAFPAPFVQNYPFGIFVATATLNASNADAAQIGPIPAGYFNKLCASWDLCIKGATATQAAGSLLTVNVNIANEYAQSPVTVSTLAFPTQTQAAAGTFEGCVTLQTSTTGSSGKFWASTPDGPWVNFLNTVPATQVVTADASAAASSAVNLTKQIYLSVNLQAANANNITGPIINSVSITPRQ